MHAGQFEIREAMAHKKTMVLIRESTGLARLSSSAPLSLVSPPPRTPLAPDEADARHGAYVSGRSGRHPSLIHSLTSIVRCFVLHYVC